MHVYNVNYPDHDIDPKDKDKEWCLKYIKAMYAEYRHSGWNVFLNHLKKYTTLRAYAQGRQSVSQYKERLDCNKDNNKSFLNISWKPLPVASKFVSIVQNKVMQTGYEVGAKAIDPLAISIKKQAEFALKAEIMLKDLKQQMAQYLTEIPGPVIEGGEAPPPEQMPQNIEELEMYMENDFKLAMEYDIEDAIKVTHERNDYDAIRRKYIYDLVTIGVGGVKLSLDSEFRPKIRRVDPFYFISSFSNNEDFNDIKHAGEIIFLTYSELKAMAGNQFTQAEYDKIKFMQGKQVEWNSSSGSVFRGNDYGVSAYRNKIAVLDAEWFSVDHFIFEKKMTKYGNEAFYDNGHKAKGKDNSKEVPVQMIYKGKWIVGTDYIFDFGLRENMPRKKSKPETTSLSYHMFAPNMVDGVGLSLVEHMMSLIDLIQIAWFKLQDAIARAIPDIINIDVDAYTDIVFDQAGTKMHPKDMLNLMFTKGVVFYSGERMNERGSSPPMSVYKTGMLSTASEFMNLMNQFMDVIRWLTGINEMTDASTPHPETLKSVAEAAIAGSNNALAHLFRADRKILESVSRQVSQYVGLIAKNNPSVFEDALGFTTQKMFEQFQKSSTMHDYGIIINKKAGSNEWAEFRMLIQEEMRNGLISFEDYLAVKRIDNIKKAERLLALKKKKKVQEAQQMSAQQDQMAAQQQQQAATMSHEMKMAEIEAEKNAKIEVIQVEHQTRLEHSNLRHEQEIQQLQIKSQADRDVANIESEGDKAVAGMRNRSSAVKSMKQNVEETKERKV